MFLLLSSFSLSLLYPFLPSLLFLLNLSSSLFLILISFINRMVIFDNASPSTRRSPFESRYAQLVFDILPNNPLIISMQQESK